ncbi:acetate--CoA ligase [Nocardia cyriacigeorgica]|uniref:acetate--CoA ligase n=1 Tax=Nocardia cyriacigeorgica TaxID=135487 RepID=A0A6P1CQH4_9NOCA|nr:acetate--CoA ligase [Nocardia cyriacigeorgica]NEW34082.1 acetate--CoA ligase [Nocardia cyriacigeorgica]
MRETTPAALASSGSFAWPPISKPASARAGANMTDYERACREFSWEEAARSELDRTTGWLNIAHEAVDRRAAGADAEVVALRWLGASGAVREYTYAELARATNKFANVLGARGIGKGDRVCVMLGRVPELYIAVLGALKAGCVVSVLFSAFGPEPVYQRLSIAEANAVVTSAALYRRKVAPVRERVPSLRTVLLTDGAYPDTDDLAAAMSAANQRYDIVRTAANDPALLHFTSGTTGRPKGAVHVHQAVLAHRVTARYALDLRAGDVFWCTADPGWVTGMSYGVIAPMCLGATVISDAADFDPARWYDILTRERVSVWYTAPTALRMLMRFGDQLPEGTDLSAIRFITSVGEPLNPEVVVWGQHVLGHAVHDNWWQTETGAIMIANFAATEVRPGSMGRPLPGIEATVVRRDADGRARVRDDDLVRADPGETGELALRTGWPSMFRGYRGERERYERCFSHGWYLTGDLVRRDRDGYFWFVGRADDVIKSAGHLVGPFEVESALMQHPAVAEAGVIGAPDPVAGERVVAFVVVRPDYRASEQLRAELTAFGRKSLGAVAPKAIEFVDALPHTRSGKVMRRLLKARHLGLPEGDTSTVENLR